MKIEQTAMQRFTSLSSLPKWDRQEAKRSGLMKKVLARKEVFAAILQNLKRQGFYPPSSLQKNTRVPTNFAHITCVLGTRSGDKTAVILEIREILKAGKNPAPDAKTYDAMNVRKYMQTSNVHWGGSSSSSSVQKNPMRIKPNNPIQALMHQMRAMQARVQRLMACNYQRAAQKGSHANWQQRSFTDPAYNLFVPPWLNPYGARYYNPGMFNGNFPTVQNYSF